MTLKEVNTQMQAMTQAFKDFADVRGYETDRDADGFVEADTERLWRAWLDGYNFAFTLTQLWANKRRAT